MPSTEECMQPGQPALAMREFYLGDEDPMYVQQWRIPGPAGSSAPRAILVHGAAHTGACWTTCPDGRPGWAKLLANRGWTVFVVDWAGVGRSRRGENFLETGPAPTVSGIRALLEAHGPAVLFGHSMGAAFAVKVIDEVPELVEAFVAITPAPVGGVASAAPGGGPSGSPLRLDENQIFRVFTNSDRFPRDFAREYRRSLCGTSPAVVNAVLGQDNGSLTIRSVRNLNACPAIVLAGDQDVLTPASATAAAADFLGADYVLAGRDWGLSGFGHMIPIEIGSEQLLEKLLKWLTKR